MLVRKQELNAGLKVNNLSVAQASFSPLKKNIVELYVLLISSWIFETLYRQIGLFRHADFFVQKLFPIKVANIKTKSAAMHCFFFSTAFFRSFSPFSAYVFLSFSFEFLSVILGLTEPLFGLL